MLSKNGKSAAFVLAAAALVSAPAGRAANLAPSTSAELQALLAGPAHTKAAAYMTDHPSRIPSGTFDRLWLWNEIALDTTAIDHTPVQPGEHRVFGEQFGPARSSRAMAIIHIAMFEAVNAVYQQYKSYVGLAPVSGDVSVDYAIDKASHDAQVALYPSQQPRLDTLYAIDTFFIHASPAAKAAGVALGQAAAAAIVARRTNDGSQIPDPIVGQGFMLHGGPGYWSPDPVSQLNVALGAYWGQVTPFVLSSGSQFRPPPPPALTDQAYTTAFDAVQQIGGDPKNGTATTRTPAQTFEGIFWTYDGTPMICAPPRLYNQVARTVGLQHGVADVSTAARFLALINTAMADAAIAAWDAKYYYQFWRPVTAIRSTDQGGNTMVHPDPTWYPLGAAATNTHGPNFTPPFPAYVSGHATIGGAMFEILRHYVPDATPFVFISDEYDGLNKDIYGHTMPFRPQYFKSITDASLQNSESRVYIGVHWQFDADMGVATGTKVGDWVYANAFQPAGH